MSENGNNNDNCYFLSFEGHTVPFGPVFFLTVCRYARRFFFSFFPLKQKRSTTTSTREHIYHCALFHFLLHRTQRVGDFYEASRVTDVCGVYLMHE